MAAGGGVDAVDHFGGDVHRGMETKGHIGTVNIVVDGLGQADHVQALFRQQIGGLMSAIAPQAEQAVQLHVLVVFLHGVDLVHVVVAHYPHQLEGGAFGAQDRTAHRQNAGKLIGLHHPPVAVDQAGITVDNADDLHILAKALIQRLGHTPDGCVQARAVSPGCQDTYTFFHSRFLLVKFSGDCIYRVPL